MTMEGDTHFYTYTGPVYKFELCIVDNWFSTTYAVSEKKARSNFTYQFKKTHGYSANAKITLPGKIQLIE